MKQHVRFTMLIFLLVVGCRDHLNRSTIGSNSAHKEKMILYSEDSAVKGSRQEPFLRNLSQILGLPRMDTIRGDMCIRAWIWDFKKKYVIDISRQGNKGKCSIVAFNSKIINGLQFIILHAGYADLQPSSGWQHFFSKMEEFRIPYLKGGKSFEKTVDMFEGMSYYQFEISSQSGNRFYEYLEPAYFRYVNDDCRNIHEFLQYFNYEMQLEIYTPTSYMYKEPDLK